MRTETIFLTLLCLVISALAYKCPDQDRLPTTCECEDDLVDRGVEIELSCSGSTIVELRDALRLMDKSAKLEVHLDFMALDPLPSDLFNGWNVVTLEISHCELNSQPFKGQKAFSGLEDKLQVLSLYSSFPLTNQLTKIDLSHLNRLRELDLSYSHITELSDDWFAKGPVSLTHLTLSNNGIEKIGDKAFANLVNLENLQIDGSRFGPIKRSMLPTSANRLEHMELDNNDFTSVPDDLFTDMPALKILSIKTNRITSLQERAFKPIWSQLELIDVIDNPLACDSTMEWMFGVKSDVIIFGFCQGPLGRKELDKFIEDRGL